MSTPTRTAVWPASPHAIYMLHGDSRAIRFGDLRFVSGQADALADGSPELDLARQMALAYDNFRGSVVAAGATFDDVVDLTFFLINPAPASGSSSTA